tara:strand:- start:230 stop:769 length:540 start_codon:yes stop_codon:yes gene_type:complete
MKKTLFISFGLVFSLAASAQKLSTRNAEVSFFSATPVENIDATNQQVSSILNLDNGQFAFLVPIKAFQFEKALMQEHFNENYMESGQFPTAKFTGEIVDYKKISLDKDGKYTQVLAGTMTMHGVSQEIKQEVMITVKGGKLSLKSDFNILASDYKVEIPAAKADNISNSLAVKVSATYD